MAPPFTAPPSILLYTAQISYYTVSGGTVFYNAIKILCTWHNNAYLRHRITIEQRGDCLSRSGSLLLAPLGSYQPKSLCNWLRRLSYCDCRVLQSMYSTA